MVSMAVTAIRHADICLRSQGLLRPVDRLGPARALRLRLFEYDQSFPRDFATTLQQLEKALREAAAATVFDGVCVGVVGPGLDLQSFFTTRRLGPPSSSTTGATRSAPPC
jgi:hypothetical protein